MKKIVIAVDGKYFLNTVYLCKLNFPFFYFLETTENSCLKKLYVLYVLFPFYSFSYKSVDEIGI